MRVEKIHMTSNRQAGLTLIELMISIALGLLILAAATAMTVKSVVMNTDTLASARLNQNLDSVVQVMVNEIRRAGYTGAHFNFADNEDLNIVSNTCVLYAYNANDDPPTNLNLVLDDNEKLGFKLVGSEIHMRTSCPAAEAACPTDCTKGTWVPLTDDNVITITNLNFHSSKSKCISLTDSAYAVLGNTNNYWITNESTTATQFPCMATSGTGLTTYALNSSDVYAGPATFVAPQTGDRLIGSRLVNLEIAATLAADNTVTKSQVVEINVRNDHIRCIGFACP
jgi:type IV pilus assembly protein PilW